MKKPSISVIMPVYNEEKFLDESIQSILKQTFKDFEFIIIDNGSKDNSLKIIKSYKDKRIKLIHLDKNIGATNAVNLARKKAKGKYIASFCADDISSLNRFKIEFDYLEKNTHIFLVGGPAIYIDKNGKEIRRFKKYNNYKMLAWRLRKSCSIVFPSTMFHNEPFYLDPDFITDDYNFYFELLKNGKNLTNLPNFLVKHRVHNESFSIYNKKKMLKSEKMVLKKFKELKQTSNIFYRIYYHFKLFLHALKTMGEKRILRNLITKN